MSQEEELLEALWCEATQRSLNAATLTHNIGVAVRYLETLWDDKAKRIIGALVILNAAPMHTTMWAALFQQMREADTPTIKVYILKQFSNICWTLPSSQAGNAFRAFVLEVRPLLTNVEVVVNVTFQKSFATIVRSFSSFAEKKLSDELFDAIYQNLKEWKRIDCLRAAATIITVTVNENPKGTSPEELLRQAKYDLECLSFAILLDTLVSAEINPGRVSKPQRIDTYCDELEETMRLILAAPQANEKVIPTCINTYRRLKQLRSSWEPVTAMPFTLFIFDALVQPKVSKLLLCPFLQFLQVTSCTWSQRSTILWQLTSSNDPFVRADVYLALASTARVMEPSDKRLVFADLLERLRLSIDEGCSYTNVAILKFLKMLLSHGHFQPITEEAYLSKLLHLCRRHGMGLLHDVPALLELLNIFHSSHVAPDSLVLFTIELFLISPDRTVARKAFSVLAHFSTKAFLDGGVQANASFTGDLNYFEGVMQMLQEEPLENELLPVIRLHRSRGLAECVFARLATFAGNEVKTHLSCLIVSDAVKEMCAATEEDLCGNDVFKHSVLCLLTQLLLSQNNLSSDAYVSLVQASATCLQGNDRNTCKDIHLLSSLVQHSWSVITNCTTAMFSIFVSKSVSPACRYFCTDSLSQPCYHLILLCRDIALSNEVSFYDSLFHEILLSNAALLTSCILLLRYTPFFLAELLESASCWLECCIVLASCSPKSAFHLLTALLEVAITAMPTRDEGNGDPQSFLMSVARQCNGVLKHVIEMDLISCSREVSNFLLLFVLQDAEKDFFCFQELIANKWTLIGELFLFCERIVFRLQSDSDAEALASMLKVLLALCDSAYCQEITRVIPRCSLIKLLHLLAETPDFAQKRECVHSLSYILAASDASKSVEEQIRSLFSLNNSDRDFFDRVDRFAQLWNANSTEVQSRLRVLLASSLNLEMLVCAAAVDVHCIPKAVQAALRRPAEREVLDVLLLIVSEAKHQTLPPLLLDVRDAVMGRNDDILKAIMSGYPGGWYEGELTNRLFLSGAWRSLDTPLTQYLKNIFRLFHGDNLQRNVFCKGSLSVSNGYENPFSCLGFTSGQGSAEIISCEIEKIFPSLFAREALHQWGIAPLHHIFSLGDRNSSSATTFGTRNIHLVAILLSRGAGCNFFSWDFSSLLHLLQLFVSTTADAPPESELKEWLQLSCWLLFYRACHLSTLEKVDTIHVAESGRLSLFEELTNIFVQLSNLFFCSNVKSLHEAAVYVIRYAVRNATIFTTGGISERLFWLVAQHCIDEVWNVIATEVVASLKDPSIVVFLCRAHVKVGLPFSVQRELHAIFTPQLLSYGKKDSQFEEDSLRLVLWLVGNIQSSDAATLADGGGSFCSRATEVTDTTHIGEISLHSSAHKHLSGTHSRFDRSDARSLSAAIRHVTKQLAHRVLSDATAATPSSVLDALGILSRLAPFESVDAGCAAPLRLTIVTLAEVYHIVHDFITLFPLLDANASLDPPAHCLQHLLGQLPIERRLQNISDALCLNSIVSLLTKLLQGWLRGGAGISRSPAQLPCALALYIPYLLRCDLPSYICALQCLHHLSMSGVTPETGAIYTVTLPRLMEDLVDVQWGSDIAGCWYGILFSVVGCVPGALQDGGGQLYWRIWEGLWRCASSMEFNCSQYFTKRVQQSVQCLIKKLTVKSMEWELCRLVVLDCGLQHQQVTLMPFAECEYFTDSNFRVFFWMARELQKRSWRSQLLETQSIFVYHSGSVLDSDSFYSLLFEFEKAGAPLYESPERRDEYLTGENAACVVSERVHDSLFDTADPVLAALNHFNFSSVIQRRSFLHGLLNVMLRYSNTQHQGDVATPPWTEVYFDALYDRTSWYDEGLWTACALAAATVGKKQPSWSQAVLMSLIPASSSAWKRGLLMCIDQHAKSNRVRHEAHQFFRDASERLSVLRNAPPPWKHELLAAILLVFSA